MKKDNPFRKMKCQIRHDLRMGLAARKREWAAAMAVILFLAFLYLVKAQQACRANGLSLRLSCMDLLAGLLGGQKEMAVLGVGDVFDISVPWLILFLLPFFLSMGFSAQDRKSCGYQYVTRCGSTDLWWGSKITVMSIQMLLYFGMIFAVCLALGGLSGGGLTAFHPEIADMLEGVSLPAMGVGEILVRTLLIPFWVCLGMGVLGSALSLIWSPTACLLLVIVILTASVYWAVPMLPGNVLMLYRAGIVSQYGGILWGAVLFLTGGFLGACCLKRTDFL